MIRLTRHSDYGVLILTHLARAAAVEPVSSRSVAEDTGLSLPMVSKILKLLSSGGLLTSYRGIKGGYELAHAPEAISIARVVEALEGPIALTECIENTPGSCDLEALCQVRDIWQRVNYFVRKALEDVSLADMLAPLPHLPQPAWTGEASAPVLGEAKEGP